MDSKQSISLSATSSIKTTENILTDGYELKKKSLKKWIYDNDHTQTYVAMKLKLAPEEFKRKLRECEKFDREQIKRLVYLMGAKAAFEVLVFPSKRKREKVWWQVFGKCKKRRD